MSLNLELQHYLERIANLLRSEARTRFAGHGIVPTQFDALHYLSICNRYSDTPLAVAEYLGQTKGTVSQSLKSLEGKGLIRKVADLQDRRIVHLKVTGEGARIIRKLLPSPLLQQLSAELSDGEQQQLTASLRTLLLRIQRLNRSRGFGQCKSCMHNIAKQDGTFTCGLTGHSLASKETLLICREHEAA